MVLFLQPVGRFFSELKRRKVYQVTAVYVVLAAGGLEVLDLLIPATRLPPWTGPFFLGLVIVGLPLVIVFAWTFDITPQGVQRTPRADSVSGTDTAPGAEDARGDDLEERGGPEPTEPGVSQLDLTAVAVLPFQNLSGSDDAEPFAVGLHDDLLTELSRASALAVISRTSVNAYRDSQKTIREIAGELGAGSVVEAGVQKAGNRVRLNVQLIDARNDAHRWAERFDRELTPNNIFDLQSELAEKIMAALKIHLTTEEEERGRSRPTNDLEAYRLYAMGREVSIERSEEALKKASEYFRRAVERDESYALAWAGLGGSLVALLDYRHLDHADVLSEARGASSRALTLDPQLPEAHSALGNLRSYLRECPGALRSHSRAIRLRPSYAGAHQWTCWVELLMGHATEAVEAALKATRLDPLDPEARGNLAMARLAVGDPAEALAEARRALEQYPGFDYSRWVEGLALWSLDRTEEGSRVLQGLTERWARDWPDTARALHAAARREDDEVRESLHRLRAVSVFGAGITHAALGETDAAFEAIRRAEPLAWDETLFLRFFQPEPMASLRRNSGFREAVARLNRSWGMED